MPGASARELSSPQYGRVDRGETETEDDDFGLGTGNGMWRSLVVVLTFAVGMAAAFFAGTAFGHQGSNKSMDLYAAESSDGLEVVDDGPGKFAYHDAPKAGDFGDEPGQWSHSDPDKSSSWYDMNTSAGQGLDSMDGPYSPILGMKGYSSCKQMGACGTPFSRGRSCQCSESCKEYDNCCPDYLTACASSLEPPTPAPPYGVFDCETDLDLGEVVMSEKKGLALDDTTFEHCADQLPTHWPNTQQKVGSVRLFKPWGMTDPKFFHGDRYKAWKGLKGFAQASGAKFLIGVSVTCRQSNDEKEWAAGREFMKYVGMEHVMGIAVGNEIDLQVGASNGACINELWNRGGYIRTLQKRVDEFDTFPGAKAMPITAVLSMFSMNGYPFKWTVSKFLKDAWSKYGDRFRFSINVYPQFSRGLSQAGCDGSVNIGTKFSAVYPAGFIPNVLADIKKRLKAIGAEDMKMWLGEHGWATHAYCVLCGKACSSRKVQAQYYANFLKWDLSASDVPSKCGPPNDRCAEGIKWAKTDGIYAHPDWYPDLTAESPDRDFQIFMAKAATAESRSGCSLPCDAPGAKKMEEGPKADHVFYFTLRDSSVFGSSEAFGILEHCGSKRCKFQKR